MNYHPKTQLSSNPDLPDSSLHHSPFLVRHSKFRSFHRVHPEAIQRSKWRAGFTVLLFSYTLLFAQWPQNADDSLFIANCYYYAKFHSAVNDLGSINIGYTFHIPEDFYQYAFVNKLNKYGEFHFETPIMIESVYPFSRLMGLLNSYNGNVIAAYWDYYWQQTPVPPPTWNYGPVRLQKFDEYGNTLWNNFGGFGEIVGNSLTNHYFKHMISDLQGGAIILFNERDDYFNNTTVLKLQHINSNGIRQYGLDGYTVYDGLYSLDNPRLISIDNEYYYLYFNINFQSIIEKRNISGEIVAEHNFDFNIGESLYHNNHLYFTQITLNMVDGYPDGFLLKMNKMDQYGNLIFGDSGIFIDDILTTLKKRFIQINNDNSLSISWDDGVENDLDINRVSYQIVESDGTIRFNEPISPAANGNTSHLIGMVPAINQKMLIWYEDRGNGFQLFAQKMSPTGAEIWVENDVHISNIVGSFHYSYSIPDARSGAVIFLQDSDSAFGYEISYFGNLGEVIYPGDISGDETVNIIDIIQYIQDCILTDNYSESCYNADLIQDGSHNIQDVILLVNIILNE